MTTATKRNARAVPEGLTQSEYKLLMSPRTIGDRRASTYARDRMLVELLAGTGLRVNEALKLARDRVDLEDRSLWIPAKHSKSGQARKVYMGPTLTERLREYLADIPSDQWRLFVTRTGEPLTDAHVRRLFKKLAERAGIDPERLSPHKLRHTYATRFLGEGGSLDALRDQLGHSSIQVTAIYLRAASWHRRSEADRLDL